MTGLLSDNKHWCTVAVLDVGAAKLLCGRLTSCGLPYRTRPEGSLTQVCVPRSDLTAALDLVPADASRTREAKDSVSYGRYRRLLVVLPLAALAGTVLQHAAGIAGSWPIAVSCLGASLVAELCASWRLTHASRDGGAG